jgi:hypothetical protein
MTIKDLSGYHDLSKYVTALECELRELRSKAYGVSSSASGEPSGGHGGCKSDRVGRYAAAIVDKEQKIHEAKRACEIERERIFTYITGEVSRHDRQVATMMYWRFIQRLSWAEVAARTHVIQADNCRKAVMRYLERFG